MNGADVTVTESDVAENRQLDMMAHLSVIQALRTVQKDISLPPSKKKGISIFVEDDAKCLLNWTAQLFVRDEKDVMVATSLSIERDIVTLYVSKNRSGPPTSEDKKVADALVAAVNKTLLSKKSDRDKKAVFWNLVIRFSRSRMVRKFRLLKTADSWYRTKAETIARFVTLVDKWEASQCVSGDPDDSTSSAQKSAKKTTDDPDLRRPDYIKSVFRELLSNPTPNHKKNDIVTHYYFRDIMAFAHNISLTHLIRSANKDSAWVRRLDRDDRRFLAVILRRIAPFRDYHHGAHFLVLDGLRVLKQLLPNYLSRDLKAEPPFRVVWVGSIMDSLSTKLYRWPTSYDDRLGNIGRSLNPHSKDIESSIADLKAAIFGRTWRTPPDQGPLAEQSKLNAVVEKEGSGATPTLHPEIQMVHYLLAHGITPDERVIGTNKRPCWACYRYLEALQDALPSNSLRLKLAQDTSGKVDHQWLIPHLPLDFSDMRVLTNEIVERAVKAVEMEANRTAEREVERWFNDRMEKSHEDEDIFDQIRCQEMLRESELEGIEPDPVSSKGIKTL